MRLIRFRGTSEGCEDGDYAASVLLAVVGASRTTPGSGNRSPRGGESQ